MSKARRFGCMCLFICFVAVLMLQPVCAADQLPAYEPYTQEEFPIWSGKLRRAEILFFGSFPLTLPVTILGYNIATSLGAPPFEATPGIKTTLSQVGIAAGLSFVIALTDFIIGEVRGE